MSRAAQIHKTKEDLVALLRALANDETLQIEFDEECRNNFFAWNQNLILSEKMVRLPEISPQQNLRDEDKIENLEKQGRAALDMALSYILFHDKEIHAQKKFV